MSERVTIIEIRFYIGISRHYLLRVDTSSTLRCITGNSVESFRDNGSTLLGKNTLTTHARVTVLDLAYRLYRRRVSCYRAGDPLTSLNAPEVHLGFGCWSQKQIGSSSVADR